MIESTRKLNQEGNKERAGSPKAVTDSQNVNKSNKFEQTLRQILPSSSNRKVSEEELFSALVFERMSTLVSTSAAQEYKIRFQQAHRNGQTSYEKAALSSLKQVVRSTGVSEKKANAVYSQAFDAANFDHVKDALYDGKAVRGDPTIALSDLNSAISRAKKTISIMKREAGERSERSLDSARTTGNTVPSIGTIGNPLNIVA